MESNTKNKAISIISVEFLKAMYNPWKLYSKKMPKINRITADIRHASENILS